MQRLYAINLVPYLIYSKIRLTVKIGESEHSACGLSVLYIFDYKHICYDCDIAGQWWMTSSWTELFLWLMMYCVHVKFVLN